MKALPSTDVNKLSEKSTMAKDADDTEKVAGEMVTSLLLAKVMVLDPRKRSDNCLVVSKLNLPLRELI